MFGLYGALVRGPSPSALKYIQGSSSRPIRSGLIYGPVVRGPYYLTRGDNVTPTIVNCGNCKFGVYVGIGYIMPTLRG